MFDSTFWALYCDEHKCNHSCPVGQVFFLFFFPMKAPNFWCVKRLLKSLHKSSVNQNGFFFFLFDDNAADAQINMRLKEQPVQTWKFCYLFLYLHTAIFVHVDFSFCVHWKKITECRWVNNDLLNWTVPLSLQSSQNGYVEGHATLCEQRACFNFHVSMCFGWWEG